LASGRIRQHFGGSRDWDAHAQVPVEMIFAASRAISLASILVAKASEFIAAANAVTVSGFGSGLDRDQRHRFSLRQQEKHGTEKKYAQDALSQKRPQMQWGSDRREDGNLLRHQSHIFQVCEAEG
jgi:hypothetical protein